MQLSIFIMNHKTLSKIPIKYDWSFSDKTIKDTAYITHGYYTYPAKFIPQLASKIITEYSNEGDIIIDPFMGSGTTIVEALVHNRIGIGTDINEISTLVSQVKTMPIDYDTLLQEFKNLLSKINFKSSVKIGEGLKLAERIDYWFKPHIKEELLIIFKHILKLENSSLRDFFLVAFAQILKSCSIWMQKSIKPTRDLNKKEVKPLSKFEWQVNRMIKKHKEYNKLLPPTVMKNIQKYRLIKNGTSQKLPCEDGKADLIVTSPPYVTSYEYADLHQLPLLWFGYLEELNSFRKKFIGSSYREGKKQIVLKSKLAENIIYQLKNKKKIEVKNYFSDMLESFLEMRRVLKRGGKAAIVIGNTQFQKVDILNAEVFQEQLENIGFKTHDIIHREIPSKMLPSTRDKKSGRFTKATSLNKTIAYPTEYILIMEKI